MKLPYPSTKPRGFVPLFDRERSARNRIKNFAIMCVIFAIASGLLFRGNFEHVMIVIAFALFVGAPLCLLIALWAMIEIKCPGVFPDRFKATVSVIAVIEVSLLLSLGIGSVFSYCSIYKARTFVSETVPKLDQYRVKHGTFPHSLSNLGVTDLPSLLAEPSSYSADSDSFRFKYWNPSSLMDGSTYDSSTRHWTDFE